MSAGPKLQSTELSVTATTTIVVAATAGTDKRNRLHSCAITVEGEWDLQFQTASTDLGGAHNLVNGGVFMLDPSTAAGYFTATNEALNIVATLISASGTFSGIATYVADA